MQTKDELWVQYKAASDHGLIQLAFDILKQIVEIEFLEQSSEKELDLRPVGGLDSD